MNKACPVVLRLKEEQYELLAFEHPLAGKQIIKGAIEPHELVSRACERELKEESGLQAQAEAFWGTWQANFEDQIWWFYLMKYEGELPEGWTHYTTDDGGHTFKFFWQPLDQKLDDQWHPLFKEAINYIRQVLVDEGLRR